MSRNIKFWLIASLLMVILGSSGFVVGVFASFGLSERIFGSTVGLSALGWLMAGMFAGIIGAFFGLIIALIFIRRLGKRWGDQLKFGRHPVLKLTVLAFISFLIISLIILEFLYRI